MAQPANGKILYVPNSPQKTEQKTNEVYNTSFARSPKTLIRAQCSRIFIGTSKSNTFTLNASQKRSYFSDTMPIFVTQDFDDPIVVHSFLICLSAARSAKN
jgi:hypothetical protein